MVELSDADRQALHRERASEIFQNIFSEIFLANCGNPVDFLTAKSEIEKKMKIQFDNETILENLEQCFNDADVNKVS